MELEELLTLRAQFDSAAGLRGDLSRPLRHVPLSAGGSETRCRSHVPMVGCDVRIIAVRVQLPVGPWGAHVRPRTSAGRRGEGTPVGVLHRSRCDTRSSSSLPSTSGVCMCVPHWCNGEHGCLMSSRYQFDSGVWPRGREAGAPMTVSWEYDVAVRIPDS